MTGSKEIQTKLKLSIIKERERERGASYVVGGCGEGHIGEDDEKRKDNER